MRFFLKKRMCLLAGFLVVFAGVCFGIFAGNQSLSLVKDSYSCPVGVKHYFFSADTVTAVMIDFDAFEGVSHLEMLATQLGSAATAEDVVRLSFLNDVDSLMTLVLRGEKFVYEGDGSEPSPDILKDGMTVMLGCSGMGSYGVILSGRTNSAGACFDVLSDSAPKIIGLDIFADSNLLTIRSGDPEASVYTILYKDFSGMVLDCGWKIAASGISSGVGGLTHWADAGNTEISRDIGFRMLPSMVRERHYMVVVEDRRADADGDGVCDGVEKFVYGSDPLLKDTDGDGLDDGEDVGLDPSLGFFYPMNEGVGDIIYDYAVLGSHGRFQNGASWDVGALSFNGTDDFVRSPSSAALRGPTDFTFGVWLKTVTGQGVQTLIQQRQPSGINGEWMVTLSASGMPQLMIYDLKNKYQVRDLTAPVRVDDGEWHQVVVVRRGRDCSIFVDGVKRVSGSGPVCVMDPALALVIGKDFADNNKYFKGSMKNVFLYSRALSDKMVQTLSGMEKLCLSPLNPDNDADGILDGIDEMPFECDRDNDGLLDGDELAAGTDPTRCDTDGDGFGDESEVIQYGTDPCDAKSNPAQLPAGWRSSGVNSPKLVGRTYVYRGCLELSGSGADIWRSADQFQFMHVKADGDFDLSCRVASMTFGTSSYARAGIMVRDSLSPEAANVLIAITPGAGILYQSRDKNLAKTTVIHKQTDQGFRAPYFVRLIRRGETFSGYYSSDGREWTLLGSSTAYIRHGSEVGFGVCATNNNMLCTAIFDSICDTRPLDDPVILADSSRIGFFLEKGSDVLYRVDSANEVVYESPFIVSDSARKISAWSVREGFLESATVHYPVSVSRLVPGLSCSFYRTDSIATPDFSMMTPFAAAVIPKIEATPEKIGIFGVSEVEYVGFRANGKLWVPETGYYVFSLFADDTACLTLDSEWVLNAPRSQKAVEKGCFLNAGYHDLRLDFNQLAGATACTLTWHSDSMSMRPVGYPYLFSEDTDDDGIADEYERVMFGSLEVANALSDQDGDMLTDAFELQVLNTDPLKADLFLKSELPPSDLSPGLMVSYASGSPQSLTDLLLSGNRFVYAADTVCGLELMRTPGSVGVAGKTDHFEARYQGYLNVPADGVYTFYMVCDDAARLSVGAQTVILNDGEVIGREVSGKVILQKGFHPLRIDLIEITGDVRLNVEWESGLIGRRVISENVFYHSTSVLEDVTANFDTDGDGLSDRDEVRLGTDTLRSDSDDDGVSDAEEIRLGTNPHLADTDGDGILDADEIYFYLSDPLVSDFSGRVQHVSTISGSDYLSPGDGFTREDGCAVGLGRGGVLNYRVTLPSGVMRLTVHVSPYGLTSDSAAFRFSACADGHELGESVSAGGRLRFMLPAMDSGAHEIQLRWFSIADDTFCAVEKLVFEVVEGGVEGDDWVDVRENAAGYFMLSDTSLVSPVCVEGVVATAAGSVSFPGNYGIDTPVARQIHGGMFYADVPLLADTVTQIRLFFGNTGRLVSDSCRWVITDVSEFDGVVYPVRMGDTMRFSPGAGRTSLTVNGVSVAASSDSPYAMRFESPGVYRVVSGKYVMTVRAVASGFSRSPVAVAGVLRQWGNPALSYGLTLESDRSVAFSADRMVLDGTRILWKSAVCSSQYMTARLYSGGPIVDVTRLNVIRWAWGHSHMYTVLEKYADGSQLIQCKLVLSDIPPDLIVEIRLSTFGVMFADGSTVRRFTAADFLNGVLSFEMLRDAAAVGAPCHYIRLYQGDELIEEIRI